MVAIKEEPDGNNYGSMPLCSSFNSGSAIVKDEPSDEAKEKIKAEFALVQQRTRAIRKDSTPEAILSAPHFQQQQTGKRKREMDEAGLPGNKRQRINAHGSRWDQTGMNDVNGGTVSQPWRSQSPGQINQAHQQPQNYTPPQGQFVHGYPTLPFHPPIMPAWNFAPPMQFNPVFEFAPQFPPQQAMVWPNQNQQSALQEHARQQCNNDIYLEGIKEGEQRAEKRHTSKVQEYELRLREKDIECERKLKGLAAHQTGIKEGERRAEQRRNNMVQTYERRLKNKDTKLEQKLKGLECRYETRVQEARSEARREALKEFAPVQPQRNPHPQGIPLTRIYDQPPYPVLSYEERVDLAINARTHRSDSIEVVVGGSTSCDDDTRKEMNDAIASRVAAWEKQNQA